MSGAYSELKSGSPASAGEGKVEQYTSETNQIHTTSSRHRKEPLHTQLQKATNGFGWHKEIKKGRHIYLIMCVTWNVISYVFLDTGGQIFVGPASHKKLVPRKCSQHKQTCARVNHGWGVQKKSYACVHTTFTVTYGEQQLEKRLFAWGGPAQFGILNTCDNLLYPKLFIVAKLSWFQFSCSRRPTKINIILRIMAKDCYILK